MKLVTVTPAGRRRYLEILVRHLLRQRDHVAQHQFWLNTTDQDDIAWMEATCRRHPDFFELVRRPLDFNMDVGPRIWQFAQDCVDPDTVYVRMDDDICYIADDALKNIFRFRVEHPEPLLVLGNIVNNAVCTHFHQRAGLLPRRWGDVRLDCMDEIGWRQGLFASRVHRKFLHDVRAGRTDAWKQVPMDFGGVDRFSINVICWSGADFRDIPEITDPTILEEPFLTEELPRRAGRPNAICPDALFAHYAFWTQRTYVESTSPFLLRQYRELAETGLPATGASPTGTRLRHDIEHGLRDFAWRIGKPVRKMRRHFAKRIERRSSWETTERAQLKRAA